MIRLSLYFTCVLGLLLAFGVDVSTFICDVTALLILGGVFHYLLLKRLPDNFWPILFAIFFGPILIAALLRALYIKTVTFLFATFGWLTIPVLCVGAVTIAGIAFLYVRSQVLRLTGTHRDINSLEERRPIRTLLPERLEESCGEQEESESSNDSADED